MHGLAPLRQLKLLVSGSFSLYPDLIIGLLFQEFCQNFFRIFSKLNRGNSDSGSILGLHMCLATGTRAQLRGGVNEFESLFDVEYIDNSLRRGNLVAVKDWLTASQVVAPSG
jgi:hypothetical protein